MVINQLFKHTRLESSFGIIFLAVVDSRPEVLNLKQILEHFVRHRKTVIVRRTRFDLKKAEERAHVLEGLKIALDNLDNVVALIRRSASPAEAKSGLMAAFALSAIQAQAILDMRLQRLTGLEREKIIEEYASVLRDIERFRAILASDQLVLEIIKTELDELQTEFGDRRRTQIVPTADEITMEDMIAEEDMVVTVTGAGYIKRTPLSLYQSQRRGGKGKTGMITKEEDFVRLLFVASTHHTFLFFTNLGKVYWRKVYEIPQSGRTSVGKNIVNLLELGENERLATVLAVESFEPGKHIIMATRNGLVKKTEIMAYSRPRSVGIIAVDLVPGDELIAARITDGTCNVFLGSANGKSIRFHEADVRTAGRVSRGVRGLRLDSGDRIVGMEVLTHGQTLFVVTENGYGKRTAIDEYPVQGRGGKGVITIKTSVRNGQVVAIVLVENQDDMMLMTNTGMLIRIPIEGVSVISRNTQGVKLMDLGSDERVVGAVRLAEREENGGKRRRRYPGRWRGDGGGPGTVIAPNAQARRQITDRQPFDQARIAVVGAGSWGTALAQLLADKGYPVHLWVFEPDVCHQIRTERGKPALSAGLPSFSGHRCRYGPGGGGVRQGPGGHGGSLARDACHRRKDPWPPGGRDRRGIGLQRHRKPDPPDHDRDPGRNPRYGRRVETGRFVRAEFCPGGGPPGAHRRDRRGPPPGRGRVCPARICRSLVSGLYQRGRDRGRTGRGSQERDRHRRRGWWTAWGWASTPGPP